MTEESKWTTQYSLLDRVSNPDDTNAWNDFIAFYEQYIYNILRCCNVPQDYTEDLSQNILLQLWKSLPDFTMDRDRGRFRAWLNTIIRNEVRQYFRNNNKRKGLIDTHKGYIKNLIHSHSDSENLSSIIEIEWKSHITRTAWDRVKKHANESMQEIFLMSMDGKSNDDIAKTVGIEKRIVAVYKQRFKKALKEEIQKIDLEFI